MNSVFHQRWSTVKKAIYRVKNHTGLFLLRAEPVLSRIKEERKIIISPSFDNIKYDTFEIEEYPLSAQGFDWELWCRYLNPPKSWWKLENTTAPIRYITLSGFRVRTLYVITVGHKYRRMCRLIYL